MKSFFLGLVATVSGWFGGGEVSVVPAPALQASQFFASEQWQALFAPEAIRSTLDFAHTDRTQSEFEKAYYDWANSFRFFITDPELPASPPEAADDPAAPPPERMPGVLYQWDASTDTYQHILRDMVITQQRTNCQLQLALYHACQVCERKQQTQQPCLTCAAHMTQPRCDLEPAPLTPIPVPQIQPPSSL